MKDHFSRQANLYSKYRPVYPNNLYEFLYEHVQDFSNAWDCGTGNGQVAAKLSDKFEAVYASDISKQQLSFVEKSKQIQYYCCPVENTPFESGFFDLIVAAQAAHWFDSDRYFREVKRVAKPGAILALWGYSLLTISAEIDPIVRDFYMNTVGPYWPDERKHIDTQYQHIQLPFPMIMVPEFSHTLHWSLHHFEGYLNTWSATQRYLTENEKNPVPALVERISGYWPTEEEIPVTFPIFMKACKVA